MSFERWMKHIHRHARAWPAHAWWIATSEILAAIVALPHGLPGPARQWQRI